MKPAAWARVRALFERAVTLPRDERAAFVATLSEDNEVLVEVRRLLDLSDSSSCGFALALPVAEQESDGLLAPGTGLGPYELDGIIGVGGMGEVYRAHRTQPFQKAVAIKIVRQRSASREIHARFEQERGLLAQLDHPNIARLLDAGATQDGRPFIVMELVEGERIDAHCDRRRLPITERLRLFEAVLDAVAYSHRHLVVHRDLKPANVLVTSDGTVKLLDFGIAKILADDPRERSGVLVTTAGHGPRWFTPLYASPEQVRGEPVTTATDVYSLGLLLHELLAGRPAHQPADDSMRAVDAAICDTIPPPMSVTAAQAARASDPDEHTSIAAARALSAAALARRLRGDLDTIVAKMLRKEPERRYESVAAIAADLRRHLEGRPVLARPDGFTYRFGKWLRRHPIASPAAVAAVAAIAVATTIAVKSRIAQFRSTQEVSAKSREVVLLRIVDVVTNDFPDLLASGARYTLTSSQLDYTRWCRDYLDVFHRLDLPLDQERGRSAFRDTYFALAELQPDVATGLLRGVHDLCGQLFQASIPYAEMENPDALLASDHRYKPVQWREKVAAARRDLEKFPELRGLWPRLHDLVDSVERDPVRRRVWELWVRWWTTKEDPSDSIFAMEQELHGSDLVWAADLVRLLRQGPAAVPLLERAVREDPASFWARYQLGRAYWKMLDLEDLGANVLMTRVVGHAQAAATLSPRSAWAQLNLGVYAIQLSAHWGIRAKDPKSADQKVCNGLHDMYREMAVEAYERAIANAPHMALPRRNLGNLYQQWKPTRAEENYREALRLDPDDVLNVDALAAHLRSLGRRDEEIRLRSEWSEKNPDVIVGRLALAEAMLGDEPSANADEWLDVLDAAVGAVEDPRAMPAVPAEKERIKELLTALRSASTADRLEPDQRARGEELVERLEEWVARK